MTRYLKLILLIALLLGYLENSSAAQQRDLLTLDLAFTTVKPSKIVGTLTIRNESDKPITAEHPSNRQALAFVLFNPLGNAVPPVGIAKVNRLSRQISIPPHGVYTHSFDTLDFLTGSALFGFNLKSGETYRVIAVYRPHGPNGIGITSNEQAIISE